MSRDPMPATACPLCRSGSTEQIEAFPAEDLVEAYRRSFGVNVAGFFTKPSIRFLRCAACDLRFYDPLATGDSAFYEKLSALDGYYMDDKPEFAFAMRFISPRDSVLEVGGGKSGFASSIARENYTGLEFNEDAVRAAQKAGIRMSLGSLEDHAAGHREKYDVVCSFQVLEHVSDPRSFLEAAMSCLKPAGKLIVSVPSHDSFQRSVVNHLLNMPPHHVTIWSNLSLLNMAGMIGARMQHIEQEKVAAYHFGWFLQASIYRLMRRAPELKMLDLSARARVFTRISNIAARLAMPVAGPLMRRLPPEYLPSGHSVMAVLRKL